ncbi:MAG: amino acid adenylation domain-containing protein, partial [Bacteroidota bacterium]
MDFSATSNLSIHKIFEAQVEKSPNQIAIRFYNQQLTYTELNNLSNQLAHLLIANYDLAPKSVVAIMSDPSEWIIISMLAILKAGCTYLPLSSQFPKERIAHMLKDGDAAITISQPHLQSKIDSTTSQIVNLEQIKNKLDFYSKSNPSTSESGSELAYIMYTSGTTGIPNGVEITHRGIIRLVCGADYIPFNEDLTFLQLSAFTFDASTFEIWGALLNGHKLIIADERPIDFHKLDSLIKTEQVNCIWLTAALFNALIEEYPQALSTIKYLLTGGEALSVKHILKAQELLPETILINGYGPTESTTFATTYTIPTLTEEIDSIPIGKAIQHTQTYILNPDLTVTLNGEIGELYIGGYGLANGYRNQPKLTSERFIQNPFSDDKNDRLYKTGDLCRHDTEGNIVFSGRIDHQLKIRGFRVEIGEIEHALSKYPNVNQCVVIPRKTNSNIELIAYFTGIVKSDTEHEVVQCSTIEIKGLKEALKEWLPEYMIPNQFIELNKLPLNLNGKIDREKLPYAPKQRSNEQADSFTKLEKEIVDIWADIAQVDTVAKEENFFEAGGHSLQATQLVYKINKTYNCSIKLSEFYRNPTIDFLSKKIIETDASNQPTIQLNKRPEQKYHILSSPQERMWIFKEYNENSAAYNVPMKFELKGKLDKVLLAKVLNFMVQRHESFRTSFTSIDGNPVQYITPFVERELECITTTTNEIDSLLYRDASEPFYFDEHSFVRYKLYELSSNHHILFLNIHHIVVDGWSIGLIKRELNHYYNHPNEIDFENQTSSKIEYIDYAIWQKNQIKTNIHQDHIQFWKEKIGKNPIPTELTPDFERPKIQTYNGKVSQITLSNELIDKILLLAKKYGVTLNIFLLTCFKIQLARYTNQTSLIIGNLNANRALKEFEDIIGFFVNSTIISTTISENLTFEEYLHQIKTTYTETLEYQEIPFETLVEKLVEKRDPSRSPIYQILYIFQNAFDVEMRLNGLNCDIDYIDNGTSKLDLSFFVEPFNGSYRIKIEYNTDLYADRTIDFFLQNFIAITNQILSLPTIKISDIDIVNPTEKEILTDYHYSSFSAEKTIHQLFEEQTKKKPDATAIIFEKKAYSYDEINEKSNQLAHLLRLKKKKKQDDIIGVMMLRSEKLFIGLLGVLKSGSAYLPIDSNYPIDRIMYMIEDSGISTIICDENTRSVLSNIELNIEIIMLDQINLSDYQLTNPTIDIQPTDLAYTIYTSGSTGKPKAVMLEHKSVVNLIEGVYQQTDLHKHKNIICLTTFCFDIFVVESWLPLTQGMTIVMAGENENLDPDEAARLIKDHQIECLQATPSRIEWLLLSDQFATNAKGLKTILVGGEAFPSKLTLKLQNLTSASIFNMYGPTETTVWSAYKEITDAEITIGKPVQNNSIYILDNHKNLCPIGVVGEIAIGGLSLARGYLHNEKATNEKFITIPSIPKERIYLTGDLGRRLHNDEFECLGRLDFQVKVRGHRIELGEIETVILQNNKISDCVVATKEINNQSELVAYVIVSDKNVDKSIEISTLKSQLRNKLPNYMIPMHFIVMDSFPLNNNGKIDRKALPITNTGTAATSPEEQSEETLNETEKELLQIWQQILGIDAISKHDNFFELGGYSLLAIRLIHEINAIFSTNLQPKDIFQSPTISELSCEVTLNNNQSAQSHFVIKIKPGNKDIILLVPGLGGNAFTFKNFLKSFRGPETLFTLEYPDPNQTFIDMSKIKNLDELALYYVDLLPKINACGKFHIIGFSFGGRLAFEITRQLKSLG